MGPLKVCSKSEIVSSVLQLWRLERYSNTENKSLLKLVTLLVSDDC